MKHINTGFTLMELVVVIGIIAFLAGTLFVASAGAREKARQAVCISNLRQIGQAIAMYRSDYAGIDPGGSEMSPEQIGLPPSLRANQALSPYIRSTAIWMCPDDAQAAARREASLTSYTYHWPPRSLPRWYTQWKAEPAYYGMSLPLFVDKNHERPMQTYYHIVLRLEGTVRGEFITFPPDRFPYRR